MYKRKHITRAGFETWPEIKMMRNEFFPDMKIEDLMA